MLKHFKVPKISLQVRAGGLKKGSHRLDHDARCSFITSCIKWWRGVCIRSLAYGRLTTGITQPDQPWVWIKAGTWQPSLENMESPRITHGDPAQWHMKPERKAFNEGCYCATWPSLDSTSNFRGLVFRLAWLCGEPGNISTPVLITYDGYGYGFSRGFQG